MLPVVDYGSIAIVISKVTAVGSIISDDEKPGLEVFLSGMEEPVIIGFETREEALEAREELIGIIAKYYYIKELGPDFEFSSLLNENGDDDINEH